MKRSNYLWLLGTLFCTMLCFTACGDDEDGISGDAESLIVGAWQSTRTNGNEIEDGEKDQWDEKYTEDKFIFNDNGSGSLYRRNSFNYSFNWRISGNKLILDEGSDEEEQYTISQLNANTLVLTLNYKEKGYEYYSQDTYERIGSNTSNGDKEESTGKGSVKITKISAQKKTTTGLQIEVTLQTSGVSASEIKSLGVIGGPTSDAEGSLYASLGGGQTSGTCKIVAGLKSKTTYYIKGALKTTSGTVYSSIKSVTTP